MDAPRDRQHRRADTLKNSRRSQTCGWPPSRPPVCRISCPCHWHGTGAAPWCAPSEPTAPIDDLLRAGVARLGLGPTRDAVMFDVVVSQSWPAHDVPGDVADTFAQRAG